MMIFNSANGDPMLLDSVQGLRELHKQFEDFLSSSADEASFGAITNSDPAPYEELLCGLHVIKNEGYNDLTFSDDRWLVLSASPRVLSDFSKSLFVQHDGDHNHWYGSPVSLIIEADGWRAGSEG